MSSAAETAAPAPSPLDADASAADGQARCATLSYYRKNLVHARHCNSWQRVYQRNNKANGIKNIRCFPTCDVGEDGKADHRSLGHCGASVVVEIAGTAPMAVLGFAEFCKDDSRSNGPVEGAMHAGMRFSWADILSLVPQVSDLSKIAAVRPWFPCELSSQAPTIGGGGGCGSGGDAATVAAMGPVGSGGGTSAHFVTRLEVNRAHKNCKTGWHYGWISSRHTKAQDHVLRTYVLSVPEVLCCGACKLPLLKSSGQRKVCEFCPHCNRATPLQQLNPSLEETKFTVCEVLSSPPFQIFSSRRGPHQGALTLLTEQQREILRREADHGARRSLSRKKGAGARRKRAALAEDPIEGGGANVGGGVGASAASSSSASCVPPVPIGVGGGAGAAAAAAAFGAMRGYGAGAYGANIGLGAFGLGAGGLGAGGLGAAGLGADMPAFNHGGATGVQAAHNARVAADGLAQGQFSAVAQAHHSNVGGLSSGRMTALPGGAAAGGLPNSVGDVAGGTSEAAMLQIVKVATAAAASAIASIPAASRPRSMADALPELVRQVVQQVFLQQQEKQMLRTLAASAQQTHTQQQLQLQQQQQQLLLHQMHMQVQQKMVEQQHQEQQQPPPSTPPAPPQQTGVSDALTAAASFDTGAKGVNGSDEDREQTERWAKVEAAEGAAKEAAAAQQADASKNAATVVEGASPGASESGTGGSTATGATATTPAAGQSASGDTECLPAAATAAAPATMVSDAAAAAMDAAPSNKGTDNTAAEHAYAENERRMPEAPRVKRRRLDSDET